MRRQYAVYLCGGLEQLRQQPCPADGGDHTPFPTGYGAHDEYARQLLAGGWTCTLCPACGRWAVWIPDQPQPQPPMLPFRDWTGPCHRCDHHPDDHDERDGCGACALAFYDSCRTYEPALGEWPYPDDLEDE